jgi:1,4-alpha-glucan branching enzyme
MSSHPLASAFDAIARGVHNDPFSLLGPHAHATDATRTILRAFQPNAAGVCVIGTAATPIPMTRLHPQGVFEAIVASADIAGGYRLRVTQADGTTIDVEDPYRFDRVMGDIDLHLFGEGTMRRAYDVFGAFPKTLDGVDGVYFAVWAPNASRVSVVGDFNAWDGRLHVMRRLVPSGVWELFVPGLAAGATYKYEVRSPYGVPMLKADPFARYAELPPATASVVWRGSDYAWRDAGWLDARKAAGSWFERPVAIYEMHLGSWMRAADGETFLTYRELAARLVPYLRDMGFTHIELMPVLEHPYTGSWGYQVTGFFAPTSRFGTPDDFKFFVDECHVHGIGVLLDWVPGHFPKDAHGLARFDGTALYEHEDPRQGEHQDWGTLIFNYGRNEVRTFLVNSALFWLGEYHLDGLRVDAVASMLYLDYSRKEGQWVPNRYGGRENIEAVEFLRQLNALTHTEFPGTIMVAEESTSWPGVSRPTYLGGLGFTYKWNMGWMHDILEYVKRDPIHRRWEHNKVTFSMLYAWNENFILPFSHDEVVHGKGSMLRKMAGDEWQRAATLRTLYAYMYAHPGKKLLFMGDEFAAWQEWNSEASLPWHVAESMPHAGVKAFVRDLNRTYQHEAALHRLDFDAAGFQWIDANDNENSVFSFARLDRDGRDVVVVVLNFTPVVRLGYRIGVPQAGEYVEVLNSDQAMYGGGGVQNGGIVTSEAFEAHGRPHSVRLTLPPLGALYLKWQRPA